MKRWLPPFAFAAVAGGVLGTLHVDPWVAMFVSTPVVVGFGLWWSFIRLQSGERP